LVQGRKGIYGENDKSNKGWCGVVSSWKVGETVQENLWCHQ
jgi:hypothetical protein